MIKTISNEFLTVSINTLGGELSSIKTKDGKERLWQKDETIWNRQAPILFPWAGRMVGNSFSHNEKNFNAPLHGFLRDEEHIAVESKNNESITFTVDFNKSNLFPFSFRAEQTFSLNKETLTHSIKIINTSNETMPFGLGFHPGFICPFNEITPTRNYSVLFDGPQTAKEVLMEKGHPNGKEKDFIKNSDTIQLNDDIFSHDSICLKGLTSKTIALKENDTSNKIVVDIENFPFVLLWSATTPTLRFLCIEPWHTLPDYANAPKEWTKKENQLHITSNETFDSSISMSFFFE